jgi:type-F conjugative transfer system pilin assembly protein TrbC
MGEKALLNLAHEAKRFNATLVLRGFKDGSYVKTAQALQNIITKTGQGAIVDPELFTLFNVTAVPTYVLAKPFTIIAAERTQTPIHDKLQGHVSLNYVLEQFAKEGDFKDEARTLLNRGDTP